MNSKIAALPLSKSLPHARTKCPFNRPHLFIVCLTVVSVLLWLPAATLLADEDDRQPFLPNPVQSVSTVPGNGDVNPYGVAFVPGGFPDGVAKPGDILVSNFNNKGNLQGTGTTIVDVPANGGKVSVFFHSKAPAGLTTALNILSAGFVLVGNFPSATGLCKDAEPGSILVIDKTGKPVGSITDAVNGPWDAALLDQGNTAKYFVANALNGTVVRFDLAIHAGGVSVSSVNQIASGYQFQCDPTTFVDAPTGLVFDPVKDILYVASTVDDAIFGVVDAAIRQTDRGTGRVIYQDPTHLHGPLAMTMAPNGDLLVSNNDAINADPNQPSEIVEFTTQGKFVKQISVDPAFGGAFGLAVMTSNNLVRFAAVDDNVPDLLIWTLQLP